MATASGQCEPVVIRRLTDDDDAPWRDLTVRRRRVASPGTFGDQSLPDSEIDVRHLGTSPACGSTLGVEIGGRMVGCARVTADREDVWMLSTVYLDPQFRGRGLGGALVSAALAAVPPSAAVELWVSAANRAVGNLYRRAGFSATSVTWEPDPASWIHMRRGVPPRD